MKQINLFSYLPQTEVHGGKGPFRRVVYDPEVNSESCGAHEGHSYTSRHVLLECGHRVVINSPRKRTRCPLCVEEKEEEQRGLAERFAKVFHGEGKGPENQVQN